MPVLQLLHKFSLKIAYLHAGTFDVTAVDYGRIHQFEGITIPQYQWYLNKKNLPCK